MERGEVALSKHFRWRASLSSRAQIATSANVWALPRMKSEFCARVIETLILRSSLTNPMPRVNSRAKSDRTVEKRMIAFSRPWNPSTELTSILEAMCAPSESEKSLRTWRTCGGQGA
eukprot:scaffold29183_cov111-Isochrysis_galbana.AAC.4